MARFDPVDPRVRLAIAQWPPNAPRGAVSTFCLEHAISAAIRRRALEEGQAAALEPRRVDPNRITEDIKKQAIGVRAALEQSGLDHGPISVHEKMRDLGMTPVPSTAALARIFRDANVARAEPRKKPRASYRRFVYPAPNERNRSTGSTSSTTPSVRTRACPAGSHRCKFGRCRG